MKKILIVDDDADIRQALVVRLRANDYDPVVAVDAMTAIAQARKLKPDLILLDIGLPGGDGYLVLERLKMLIPLSGIPVIVVTARNDLENRERMLNAGAEAFFKKPFLHEELLAAIRKALGEDR